MFLADLNLNQKHWVLGCAVKLRTDSRGWLGHMESRPEKQRFLNPKPSRQEAAGEEKLHSAQTMAMAGNGLEPGLCERSCDRSS